MNFRVFFLSLPFTAASLAVAATPAPPKPAIDVQFDQTVKPFVGKYCVTCHSGKMAPAQFDLKSYTSVDMVADDFGRWSLLAERLKNKEMPPKPMPARRRPKRSRSSIGSRPSARKRSRRPRATPESSWPAA